MFNHLNIICSTKAFGHQPSQWCVCDRQALLWTSWYLPSPFFLMRIFSTLLYILNNPKCILAHWKGPSSVQCISQKVLNVPSGPKQEYFETAETISQDQWSIKTSVTTKAVSGRTLWVGQDLQATISIKLTWISLKQKFWLVSFL